MIVARATGDDLDAICGLEESGFDRSRWSRTAWLAEIEADDRYVLVDRGAESHCADLKVDRKTYGLSNEVMPASATATSDGNVAASWASLIGGFSPGSSRPAT